VVFLGYRTKQHHPRQGTWEMEFLPVQVLEVCSVGDCMAKPPPAWVERWDFNRACCYATADAARATIPVAEPQGSYDVFAYWLLPVTVTEGRHVQVNLDDLFDARLPALPHGDGPTDLQSLGFDVFERGAAGLGFGHSLLSCNGMAKEVKVNSYCLVDTEVEALELVARCNKEQPEPGTYYAIRVARELGGSDAAA
jgi:hypothetical protein